MASKPETTFTSSVHRHLPAKNWPYREKMNNPFRSGTADWWYSGDLADLWVEYKYIPKVPAKAMILPDLSVLQADWLEGRYKEGRNVAVVVGSPAGAVIYEHLQWLEPLSPEAFIAKCLTRQQLAQWLQTKTIRRADAKPTNSNGEIYRDTT